MAQDRALEGLHALVTGGGTGIGAAIADALHAEGAALTLVGRRRQPIAAVAERTGGLALDCDVTDRLALDNVLATARSANGPIGMMIVNAGIADSAPFDRIAGADWDRILAVNLSGAFACAQAALPDLLEARAGRLVFVASVAGLRGVPYAAHYAASKHGVIGLMRSLALEYAKSRMTVNAVCPGFVDTPMTDQTVARVSAATGRDPDQSRDAIARMNANGRLVDPAGIAGVVRTLCLPGSNDINGAAITIDGGTTA